MTQTLRITTLLIVLLSLLVGVAHGQEEDELRGSIRGTIREDKNGDGMCATDPVIEGIRVEFVSNDDETIVHLNSGANGTYGLVAAGLGTWQVSASPTSGYVVTSNETVEVHLSETNLLALGVDFCVRATEAGPTVLPASGAQANPLLLLAALLGTALVVGGACVEWSQRHQL